MQPTPGPAASLLSMTPPPWLDQPKAAMSPSTGGADRPHAMSLLHCLPTVGINWRGKEATMQTATMLRVGPLIVLLSWFAAGPPTCVGGSHDAHPPVLTGWARSHETGWMLRGTTHTQIQASVNPALSLTWPRGTKKKKIEKKQDKQWFLSACW
jgi:hypothetical protein